MGIRGIDYTEIHHWQDLTGVALTAWEVETLFYLSNVAARSAMSGGTKDGEMPREMDASQIDNREAIEKKLFGK